MTDWKQEKRDKVESEMTKVSGQATQQVDGDAICCHEKRSKG